MARTDLTQDKSTLNLSTYSTVSIAPGSNRVVLAFVLMYDRESRKRLSRAAQGNGLTWQAAASIQVAGAPNRQLTCFSATGAALGTGPLSFDFGGEQQTLCAWSVFEYDGVTDIAQAKTASGGCPMPYGHARCLWRMPTRALWSAASSPIRCFGTPAQVQPGQGLAGDPRAGRDRTRHRRLLANRGSDRGRDHNQLDGSLHHQGWAAIALELTAGMSAADALELAKRFEPILYFHAAEKFFPSNAKRYIEMCALWRAQSQFDVKDFVGR